VADRRSERDRPRPYGYEAAMKDAFSIAAPLFTAASLSLAGVVAGADKAFRLPGLTLLMLVASSLVLVAAIQINYYARQFVFTVKDLHERLGHFSAWEDLGERERTREFVHMREMARDRYMTLTPDGSTSRYPQRTRFEGPPPGSRPSNHEPCPDALSRAAHAPACRCGRCW
jgi:hypothetical protein